MTITDTIKPNPLYDDLLYAGADPHSHAAEQAAEYARLLARLNDARAAAATATPKHRFYAAAGTAWTVATRYYHTLTGRDYHTAPAHYPERVAYTAPTCYRDQCRYGKQACAPTPGSAPQPHCVSG